MLEIINKCVEGCCEKVINNESEELQGLLTKIKEEVNENCYKDIVMRTVTSIISQAMVFSFEEEIIIELVCRSLEEVIDRLPELKKSYVLRCHMEGHEDYIYRTIEVPSYMSLDEFCCAVLGSFNADGYHMYSVDYDRKTYFCPGYDDDYRTHINYTTDYTLNDIDIRDNKELVITYDFGDNYEIVVRLEDVFINDFIFDLEYMYILDGEGYGIWEDHHYLLDMYYWNKDEYNEAVQEYGFIENPLEEVYDCEDEDLFEDMMYFKTMFEDNME